MERMTPEQLIGSASRAYRLELGMTQTDLARDLGAQGWPSPSQSAVAELESGRRKTDWSDWLILSLTLHVAPLVLLDIPS